MASAPEKVTRDELRQNASRHRYHYAPPPTPPGFWDMGFMDTQVCAGPLSGDLTPFCILACIQLNILY